MIPARRTENSSAGTPQVSQGPGASVWPLIGPQRKSSTFQWANICPGKIPAPHIWGHPPNNDFVFGGSVLC